MRIDHPIRTLVLVFVCLAGTQLLVTQTKPNPGINQDAAIAADFEKKIADYMKLHQQAQAGISAVKASDSAAQIVEHQSRLCAKIRELRPQVKPGDIFTPEITGLFRHLIATAMNGPEGAKIRRSYAHAEPDAIRNLKLDVNQEYPDKVPLQSMPPSLLLNLPQLPKELEYRFVGQELILRDVPANLIVDVIPDLRTPDKP